MEHSSSQLVYETNSTPLSLLYVYFEYHHDSLLQVLDSFFESIRHIPEFVESLMCYSVEFSPFRRIECVPVQCSNP